MLKELEQKLNNKGWTKGRLFIRTKLFYSNCNLCYGIRTSVITEKIKNLDEDNIIKKIMNHSYKWGNLNNKNYKILRD